MFTPDYTRIPSELIGELSPLLVSSVKEIVNARIDRSQTGSTFLVLPFAEPNEKYAILVEISNERLDTIKNRGMELIFPFQHPEKKLFYLAKLDEKNQITELAYLYPEQRKFDWPVPDTIDFDFTFTEKAPPFSLLQYSREKNKGVIEVIFEANDLEENMKIWSLKNFLLPFTDLIKTAILSNNLNVNPQNIEKKLKLGFTTIEHKCLRSILEFEYNPNLMEENIALKNLKNLYLMLDADEKDELIKYVDSFSNKKIISDTIKILRTVISNKGTLKSQMAVPDEEFEQVFLSRSKAVRRKKMLEANVTSDPYKQTVTGVLTMLNFEPAKAPLFALHTLGDDEKYYGKICPELARTINEQTFSFNSVEYQFELEVVYTPETWQTKEKYDYTLLDISEMVDSSPG